MTQTITTYYLEMRDPAALRPATGNEPTLLVQRAELPNPAFSRFLYTAVGGDWYWTDRLPWSYQRWQEYLARPELQTWVGYVRGTPAGYFELERQPDESVEIASFGLLPQFIGQKLGGRLLTAAIERAWHMGTQRVWVHTCTLDGPAALGNYQARGLALYKQEQSEVALPAALPGPWPGAR